jgi:hypothetical protein
VLLGLDWGLDWSVGEGLDVVLIAQENAQG